MGNRGGQQINQAKRGSCLSGLLKGLGALTLCLILLGVLAYFLYPHLPVEQRQSLEERAANSLRSFASGETAPNWLANLSERTVDHLPYASGLVVDGGDLVPAHPWLGGNPSSAAHGTLQSVQLDDHSAYLRDSNGRPRCIAFIIEQAGPPPPLPAMLHNAHSSTAPPQLTRLWERIHLRYAERFAPIWVFAGPTPQASTLGAGSFVIVADLNDDGGLRALALHFPASLSAETNLEAGITTISAIEQSTGLTFFPELQFAPSQALKQWQAPHLW